MIKALARVQSALSDRYRVERELGHGGMATVYLAEDLKHGRRVALKVLRPDLAAAVGESRFAREIAIAASLAHPHILPLYDSGHTDGVLFYVMPYVEGQTLRERLAGSGPVPVGEALAILHAIADALAYAHERGLVHRDIKPENILLASGHPMVSDFGIARVVESAGEGAGMTGTGMAVGTPAYMSPEQALGERDIDHRSDLYALGVVAYELLAGCQPFVRESLQKMVAAHIAEFPRPLAELRDSLPPRVADLVMRCLDKDRARRPASAREVMAVLESVSGLELTSATRVDARVATRRMLAKALSLYGFALLAVGASAWAAMIALGLPDWVFGGALIAMAAGLPAILLTAWVHYRSHRTAPPVTLRAPSRRRRSLATWLQPYATWRTTALTTGGALVLFVLAASGLFGLGAVGVGPAATLLTTGTLAHNDRVLLADFEVAGTDSALGHALTAAARVALEQSTAVRVVSQSAVASVLERMQKPRSLRVDADVAREIAQREGIKAFIQGELHSVGSSFALGMRVLDGATGDALVSVQTTAASEDELISAVGTLAARLRGRIGESLVRVRSVEPLASVTTPSLEALRKYSEGVRANLVEQDFLKSVQLLQEAVALDTGFAMAWRALAPAVANLNLFGGGAVDPALSDTAVAAAYRHRSRATLPERDHITAYYYWTGPNRDRARAANAYELILARGLLEGVGNLGTIYSSRREFSRAESLYRRLIEADPENAISHNNLILVLLDQGKQGEAAAALEVARAAFPGRFQWEVFAADLLYHRGDLEAYARALASFRDSPRSELRRRGYLAGAQLALLRGQLAEYRRLRTEIALPGSEISSAIARVLADAEVDAFVRLQPARAARGLQQASMPEAGSGGFAATLSRVVQVYGVAGDARAARALLARDVPGVAEELRQSLRDWCTAWISFAEQRYADAAVNFRRADLRADGPADACPICLPLSLALVYDAAGQADSAIAALHRFASIPWSGRVVSTSADPLFLPRAIERLGQLHEARGDSALAAQNYRRFVELWSEADSELQPRVANARRRVAALESRGHSAQR